MALEETIESSNTQATTTFFPEVPGMSSEPKVARKQLRGFIEDHNPHTFGVGDSYTQRYHLDSDLHPQNEVNYATD